MDNLQPMSREDLLAQGECCGSVCRNCPYFPKYAKGSKKISSIS